MLEEWTPRKFERRTMTVAYRNTGTGYDCAGQAKLNVLLLAARALFISSAIPTLGGTLPTGSKMCSNIVKICLLNSNIR